MAIIPGDDNNNIITGTSDDDIIDAAGGDDTVEGGLGADTLIGGPGFDTISYQSASGQVNIDLDLGIAVGAAGNDTVSGFEAILGSAFNDNLYAASAGSTLMGGAGFDVLNSRAGDDILDGGANRDYATYIFAGSAVQVTLASQGVAQNTGGAGSDTLISIENLEGSNFDDALTGNTGANNIYGRNGNDVIDGGEGDDFVEGGLGDDTLTGGAGFDMASYLGASGQVNIDLDLGIAVGAAGNDTVSGFEGIYGSSFNDNLYAGSGGSTLLGGGGFDVLNSRAGDDYLDGGANRDYVSYTFAGSAVQVTLATQGVAQNTGGGGLDTLIAIENLEGSNFDDTLSGNSSNNNIYGGGGNDIIDSGAANDFVEGGLGDDTLTGGAGFDMVSYLGASGQVNIDLDLGIAVGAAGNDTVSGFEGIYGSAFNDNLYAASAGSTLLGGGGFDVLNSRAGDDYLDGGADRDYVSYTFAGSAVQVTLATQGVAQNTGGAGSDTLIAIENLEGSNFGDTLTGNSGANNIYGRSGDDVLTGGAGDDLIDGGEGDDTAVFAGNAAEYTITSNNIDGYLTVVGPDGTDTLYGVNHLQFADQTIDVVVPGVTQTLPDTGGELVGGEGTDTLVGGDGGDVLDGGDGDDTLIGGDGEDVVLGGGGEDLIIGGHGGGDDYYDGGTGVDTIHFSSALKAVSVDLTVGKAVGVDIGHDIVLNIENVVGGAGNDSIVGDAQANALSGAGGNDSLSGGLGADVLDGGAGNDRLTGGAGADILIGAAGVDTFVFASLTDSTLAAHDLVMDFSRAQGDRIDLSLIDAVTGGKDNAFSLVTAFTGKAGQLVSTLSGDHYVVQGDVNGDGIADFAIDVVSVTPLTASDFIL